MRKNDTSIKAKDDWKEIEEFVKAARKNIHKEKSPQKGE